MELKSLGTNPYSFILSYPALVKLRLSGCRIDVLMFLAEKLAENKPFTFEEVRKACGYKNRSGAYKAIKKLHRYGFLGKKSGDQTYYWCAGDIVSV